MVSYILIEAGLDKVIQFFSLAYHYSLKTGFKKNSTKNEDVSEFRVSEGSKLNSKTSLLYIDWFACVGTTDSNFNFCRPSKLNILEVMFIVF